VSSESPGLNFIQETISFINAKKKILPAGMRPLVDGHPRFAAHTWRPRPTGRKPAPGSPGRHNTNRAGTPPPPESAPAGSREAEGFDLPCAHRIIFGKFFDIQNFILDMTVKYE
jgi:hypothetical protein